VHDGSTRAEGLHRPRVRGALAAVSMALAGLAPTPPPAIAGPGPRYASRFGPVGTVSGVAVDRRGAVYVVGSAAAGFPTTAGAFDRTVDVSGDAFVSKLSPDGSTLVYSTFLGGRLADRASGIWVSRRGEATVVGSTLSGGFPTTGDAHDRSLAGEWDGFVTTLSLDGSALRYSTYLGGSGADLPGDVVRDRTGAAFLAGYTNSHDLPATTTMAPSTGNLGDAFVAKIGREGVLGYLTVMGGGSLDFGSGVAVDARGRALVAGHTSSPGFPTTSASFDASFNGGSDGFVGQLSRDGTGLVYSTFIGGSVADWSSGVASDARGRAYVVGYAQSPDAPVTPGAFDVSKGGVADASVTVLAPGGSTLEWATFLGGDLDSDSGLAIALDHRGRASVTGYTGSGDFPTTPGAFDTSANGRDDAFAATLTRDGSALASSTLLGGVADDVGRGIAIDARSRLYVAGDTTSSDFPATPRAFGCPSVPALCAAREVFVVRLGAP